MAKPVYIHGGYQSADIILTDAFNGTHPPLAGSGGATPLVANRQYHVQARVYNTLPNDVGVILGFYEAQGGFGSVVTPLGGGFPVGAIVPKNSTTGALYPVQPGVPDFYAAPLGQHKCVVVHVRYNIEGGSDCSLDAISDPGLDGTLPQCTAWRNTDSTSLNSPRKPSPININLTAFGSVPETPTLLRASAVYVPRKWFDTPEVLKAIEILAQSGSADYPPFLLKSLAYTLTPVDLGFRYETCAHGIKIAPAKRQVWELHAELGAVPDVVLAGQIPASAEPGDVYLVRARAAYPSSKLDVEFLQVVWIV
jgi:hypothetical protein